ncbi:MAG: M56 family metallopeptidase [Prevotella sp.]|nr:M56 family metallopeptidase [Prevotella sp.]
MLYILKSAITLALLYSCFFFFLSKETFHRFNRCMLLGIMLISLIVPLLHFTTEHPTVINEEVYLVQKYIEQDSIPIVTTSTTVHRLTWVQIAAALYLTGVAVMLILTLVQVFSLVRMLHSGWRHTDSEGNTIVLLKGDVTPFSIFRYIVMNVQDYEQYSQYILTHEQEHIRLGHTYDLLLLEAMKIFQWFNPFVWFISRDLKAVHEYEADQAVIHQGIDAKSYQQLLVMKVVGNRLQPFTNNLGHGSLKKRIFMMYQKPSSRWLMLKALCAIPVVALTINAFATPMEIDPVEDFVATLETKDMPVFNETKTGNLTTEAIPTDAAKMPDDTPFAIHPVRDQYGRIIGFSHEGKPAAGDFECTYEYVFINGRQATEFELRNYRSIAQNSRWEILKTPEGTAKYNYKDKHGIICFTSIDSPPSVEISF